MEFNYNGFSLKITKEDLIQLWDEIKNLNSKIKDSFKYNKIQELQIALIDERYSRTGYIIEYIKIKSNLKNINEIINNYSFNVNPFYYYNKDILLEIFKDCKIIESSGELNGYENDTPSLKEFDLVIRI